ncbi:hypothetical protein vseg_001817 [Gypsophila vaccaria]
MSSIKDPSLRLFGKIIQLKSKDKSLDLNFDEETRDYSDDYDDNNCHNECTSSNDNLDKGENRGQHFEETLHEESRDNEKIRNLTATEHATHAFIDNECTSQDSHNKDDSDRTSSTKRNAQKPLKKPDKILPCPRCNSMCTKFCYYNNYNINQPRHFCKDCQRYWTAGGTMRNVPVGAGRRKSKSSVACQRRHLLVPSTTDMIPASSYYNSYGFVHENVNVVSPLFLQNDREFVRAPCFRGLLGVPVSCSDRSSMSSSSSTSRKHSRDGGAMFNLGHSDRINRDVIRDNNSANGRVVIPRILNVDDPIEASNSSIWNTLHLKNNHRVSNPTAKGGFFGGSQKINSSSNSSGEPSSMVLELNPAAFSRSLSFQEIAQ